jgi:steroid delta-isomerase-like uncharacterized protein
MATKSSTTTSANAAVRDFEALSRRDSEGMKASYADDAVIDLVPVGVLRGNDELKAFFDGLFAAIPDLETTYEVAAETDDTVVIEWRMDGTFDGAAFQDVEPTGKRVQIRGVDVMTIENDRISNNNAYYDAMEFARQLGMMPARESGAEKAMIKAFNASTKLRARFASR